MIPRESLIIAIDFDGTIVENAYPDIGKTMIFAFETMKKMQEDGHRLILWTYRHGKRLQNAIDFCKDNGIVFYAVNNSYPEEIFDHTASRKINADLFIDDRNIGGFIGWTEVYKEVFDYEPEFSNYKKGFFGFFKK